MDCKEIANPAKPGEKRHDGHRVEPGESAAGVHRSPARDSSGVMSAMKGQVQTRRQMKVRRTAEKRQHAEGEPHNEAEKIKVRPGHTTPRAQPFTSATYRCGARAGIRDAGPATCYLDPLGSLRLSCGEQRAADGRCPSVVPHFDNCRGAIPLRGARLSPASAGFPPEAKSRGASLHAPR